MLRVAIPGSQGETTLLESAFGRPALCAMDYVGDFNGMFQDSIHDYERK
jgi:hypothetical protein